MKHKKLQLVSKLDDAQILAIQAGITSKLISKEFAHLLYDLPQVNQPTRKNWCIKQIIDNYSYIDSDPPYQRSLCWDESMKIDLISSLMANLSIGPFHLVKKDVGRGYWLMDAKQRLNAIISFYRNDIPCYIVLNGTCYVVYWRDIEKYFPELEEHFYQIEVDVIRWDPMEMDHQAKIFHRINKQKKLHPYEIAYGRHYRTKIVLSYLFDKAFEKIKDNLLPKISKNEQLKGNGLLHQILILCFGTKLEEGFAPRRISRKQVIQSITSLDPIFEARGLGYNSNMDHDWIVKLGLHMHLKILETVARWFQKIIDSKNNLSKGKKFTNPDFTDLFVWMVKQYQNKVFNETYIETNLAVLLKTFKDYLTYKREHGAHEYNSGGSITVYGMSTSTTEPMSIETRIAKLTEIALQNGLNLSAKSRHIGSSAKLQAVLDAEPVCAIAATALSDNNVNFDHFDPSGLAGSVTQINVLSNVGNRKKTDQTAADAKKVNAYFAANSEE